VVTSAVKDAKALLHDARLRPNWWPPERKAEWCARPTYTMQHAQGGKDAGRRFTKLPPSFIQRGVRINLVREALGWISGFGLWFYIVFLSQNWVWVWVRCSQYLPIPQYEGVTRSSDARP
jgi:hypothetical protein